MSLILLQSHPRKKLRRTTRQNTLTVSNPHHHHHPHQPAWAIAFGYPTKGITMGQYSLKILTTTTTKRQKSENLLKMNNKKKTSWRVQPPFTTSYIPPSIPWPQHHQPRQHHLASLPSGCLLNATHLDMSSFSEDERHGVKPRVSNVERLFSDVRRPSSATCNVYKPFKFNEE